MRSRLGDIVPADARLLDGDPVEVDQSALTGESLPTERKSGDAVFSGSIIRQGEAGAMVYATGEKTYFGKTAQLVQEAHTVVVPTDDKENTRLIVSRIVLDALNGLKMAYPKTTAKRRLELKSIRKLLAK